MEGRDDDKGMDMFLLIIAAAWLYLMWASGVLSPAAWGRRLGLIEEEKQPYWGREMDRRKMYRDIDEMKYRPHDDDFGEGGDF